MEITNTKIILLISIVVLAYYYITDVVFDLGKKCYGDDYVVLPDIGFRWIDDKRNNKNLYTIKELMNFAFLIAFICLTWSNNTAHSAITEYIIIVAIVLFIKNILFGSTVLPDPSQKCQKFSLKNPHKGSCHDLVISTHCTLSFVAFLLTLKYGIGGNIFAVIGGVYNMILIYLILSLRQHYTIDIINAILYSSLITWIVTKS